MKTQHNVDALEIDKFDDMAAKWWDPKGPVMPLHLLNPLRIQFIKNACDPQNQHALDIGCGGGLVTEALAKHSPYVIGIDQSEPLLRIAKQHSANWEMPPKYLLTTAEEFQHQQPETFDIITCFELLEHVPNPASLVQAISQLTKPNGHIFFSTLNRTPKAFLEAIVVGEYLLKMLPKGTHHYQAFIRPSELAKLCRENNLEVKKIQGLRYQPLSKTFSFSNDTGCNYLMYCQKVSP